MGPTFFIDQTHQPEEPQHDMTQETTRNSQSKIVQTPTTETLNPSFPETKQSMKPTTSKKSKRKLKNHQIPKENTTSLPESKPLDSQSADTKESSPPYVKLKVGKATGNTPPKTSGVSQRLPKHPPITKEEDTGKISTPNPTCTQSPASTDPTSNSQPAETDPTENSKTQYDTLLCYAKENRQIALELKKFLETKYSLKVCIDLESFIPGKPTTDNISDSINSSGSVIFLLSPEFLKKLWAPWELKNAVYDFNASQKNGKQKKIIPVLLKECQVPDELKIYEPIKMEASGSQKHCWKKIAAAILDRPYSDEDSEHDDSGDDDNDDDGDHGDDDDGDDDNDANNEGTVDDEDDDDADNSDTGSSVDEAEDDNDSSDDDEIDSADDDVDKDGGEDSDDDGVDIGGDGGSDVVDSNHDNSGQDDVSDDVDYNGQGDNNAGGEGDNNAGGEGDNNAGGKGDNNAGGKGDNNAGGKGDNNAGGKGDNNAGVDGSNIEADGNGGNYGADGDRGNDKVIDNSDKRNDPRGEIESL